MPGYNEYDVKKIKEAERKFYEAVFVQFVTSVTLHLIKGNNEDLKVIANRVTWIHERSMRVLNFWRSQFCPSRVGLPIESEWPEI